MKSQLHWLSVVSAGLAVIFAYLVGNGVFRSFDYAFIKSLQEVLPTSLDVPFSLLSLLGSVEVTVVVLFAVVLLFCRAERRLQVVILFFMTALFEILGKTLIEQPGPPDEFVRYSFGFSMPTSRVPTLYALPSGHAARTTFLSILVCGWILQSGTKQSLKIALIAFLGLCQATMLLSRVYMGDHWISDVIVGGLLGTSVALPALSSLSRRVEPASERLPKGAGKTLPESSLHGAGNRQQECPILADLNSENSNK